MPALVAEEFPHSSEGDADAVNHIEQHEEQEKAVEHSRGDVQSPLVFVCVFHCKESAKAAENKTAKLSRFPA